MTRLVEPLDIFGDSTFCDDIRFEVDGKITYVGTYIGTMYVRSTFPIVLPKFGIHVMFAQRREMFDPNLGLKIFMPGDSDDNASIEADVSELAKNAAKQAAELFVREKANEEQVPYVAFHTPVIFAPFTINQVGTIRVRMLRGDELHRLGSLRIVPQI